MTRMLHIIAYLAISGVAAALLAYSLGSLALDDIRVESQWLVSISLLSAGFIALLLAIEFLRTAASDDDGSQRDVLMHQLTKADIAFSVGRGLIMAAAIVGATYFLGSWYLGGDGFDALVYHGVDDQVAAQVERVVAPATEASQ